MIISGLSFTHVSGLSFTHVYTYFLRRKAAQGKSHCSYTRGKRVGWKEGENRGYHIPVNPISNPQPDSTISRREERSLVVTYSIVTYITVTYNTVTFLNTV